MAALKEPNGKAISAYRASVGFTGIPGLDGMRRSVTYEDLARRINRGGPNLLARPLDLITRWCQRHSVPAIASLVVEQATGLPAPGFAAVTRDEIPHEQERVWSFDWFGILPPTIEELAES